MKLGTKSVGVIAAVFLAVFAGSYLLFEKLKDDIMSGLGAVYAEKQVLYNRARVLHPLMRELALARKLADSSVLKAWAREEADPALRAAGLRELEDYRRFFSDRSFFFVAHGSGHYYFNDSAGSYASEPLRYTLDPKREENRWYYETIGSGAPYKLNVDLDEQLQVTKVWINVVVRDGAVPLGIVGTGIDLTEFVAATVASERPGVVNMFVEEGGAIQAHPNRELIDYRSISKSPAERKRVFALLDDERDRGRLRAAMDRLSAREVDSVEVLLARAAGQPHLVGLSYLPAIDWYSVTLIDTGRMLGARRFAPLALLLLAALVVLSGVAVLMLNRLVIQRISRLDRSMQEFAGGTLPAALPVGPHDEMGRLEEGFRRMAQSVREGTERLEERVASRTGELERQNEKLQRALSEIRTLSGLLPTCCYCKRIRDPEGRWSSMEAYISDRTAATFSHGICPDCMVQARKDLGSTPEEA